MPCRARVEPIFALSLAASVALSGCATSLPPNPTGAEVKGQVPAEGLPRVSRIVANELPVSLAGFWNDPKERAEFEKRRAENISRNVDANLASGGEFAAGAVGGTLEVCVRMGPLCPLVLPVLIPIAATVAATGEYVVARRKAGQGEPYIPITESNSQRLHALYSGTLTSVALGERTLRLIQSGPSPVDAAAEYPRLVVTMKSATVRMDQDEELHVKVVAEVQAQPAPGATWPPTEHVIDMEFWQRYDYTVAVQKILDVLAQSIVTTYLPQHPYTVEKRLWEEVRKGDAAQVQAYLDRYPEGAYVEPARARMAELAAADAAARQRYAQGLAAERAAGDAVTTEFAARAVFAQRARVHPALEGRWSGSGSMPFCGATSYAISIKDGVVEGTAQWQLNAVVKEQVAGYVKDDGMVFAVSVASGRVDRSRTLDLSLDSGRLTGASTITCVPQRFVVSLRRD